MFSASLRENLMLVLGCGLALFLLVGCVGDKFNKQIQEDYQEVLSIKQKTESDFLKNKPVKLKWNQAKERMLRDNTSYLSIQENYAETEEKKKKLLMTEFAPSVYSFVGLSQGLTSLADISKDDIDARFVVSFRIPNPVNLYAKAYAYELQLYQLEQSLELNRRRMISSLYTYFMKERELSLKMEDLKRLERANSSLSLDRKIAHSMQIEEAKISLRWELVSHRQTLNQLLSTPGANWTLDYTTVPELSYENKLESLTVDNGFGLLALRMAAVNLEASLVGLKNAKWDLLPDFSVNIDNPNLYDSSGSQSFDLEQTQMYSSFSKSYRFDGTLTKNIERAEERLRITRMRLASEMEAEAIKNERVFFQYRALLRERDAKEKEIQVRKQLLRKPQSPTAILSSWNSVRSAQEALRQVNQRLLQLDLQFWVWDDAAW